MTLADLDAMEALNKHLVEPWRTDATDFSRVKYHNRELIAEVRKWIAQEGMNTHVVIAELSQKVVNLTAERDAARAERDAVASTLVEAMNPPAGAELATTVEIPAAVLSKAIKESVELAAAKKTRKKA